VISNWHAGCSSTTWLRRQLQRRGTSTARCSPSGAATPTCSWPRMRPTGRRRATSYSRPTRPRWLGWWPSGGAPSCSSTSRPSIGHRVCWSKARRSGRRLRLRSSRSIPPWAIMQRRSPTSFTLAYNLLFIDLFLCII